MSRQCRHGGIESFGDIHIRKIRRAHVERYIKTGRSIGFRDSRFDGQRVRACNGTTLALHLRHLKKFFNDHSDAVPINPTNGIRIKKVELGSGLSKEQTPIGSTWSTLFEHIEAKIQTTNCMPTTYLIYALMRTGCRVGELISLKWKATEEYEGKKGLTKQSYSYLWDDQSHMTINCKGVFREPPIPHLQPLFQDLKSRFPENHTYVFGNPHTGQPYNYSNFRRHFGVLLKEVGLPHFRLHSLRHGWITKRVGETNDIVGIGSIVGHTTTHMAEKYLKPNEERMRLIMTNS